MWVLLIFLKIAIIPNPRLSCQIRNNIKVISAEEAVNQLFIRQITTDKAVFNRIVPCFLFYLV